MVLVIMITFFSPNNPSQKCSLPKSIIGRIITKLLAFLSPPLVWVPVMEKRV